jgi:formate hydrogenlyase subunit 4
MDNSFDEPGQTAVMNSFELWWEKMDQEVFIAAAILNPLYCTSPFCSTPQLIKANILTLFLRLYKHVTYCNTGSPIANIGVLSFYTLCLAHHPMLLFANLDIRLSQFPILCSKEPYQIHSNLHSF